MVAVLALFFCLACLQLGPTPLSLSTFQFLILQMNSKCSPLLGSPLLPHHIPNTPFLFQNLLKFSQHANMLCVAPLVFSEVDICLHNDLIAGNCNTGLHSKVSDWHFVLLGVKMDHHTLLLEKLLAVLTFLVQFSTSASFLYTVVFLH